MVLACSLRHRFGKISPERGQEAISRFTRKDNGVFCTISHSNSTPGAAPLRRAATPDLTLPTPGYEPASKLPSLALQSLCPCSEGGFFNARLTFPKDYPNSPPTCRFTSEMWHPNGRRARLGVPVSLGVASFLSARVPMWEPAVSRIPRVSCSLLHAHQAHML